MGFEISIAQEIDNASIVLIISICRTLSYHVYVRAAMLPAIWIMNYAFEPKSRVNTIIYKSCNGHGVSSKKNNTNYMTKRG